MKKVLMLSVILACSAACGLASAEASDKEEESNSLTCYQFWYPAWICF